MIKKIKIKSIKKLKNKLNYKTCKNCGKRFITKKYKQAHCSEQCKLLYRSKIHTYTQSKACLYKNYRLASTYELRTAYILDNAVKNKNIKSWDYPRNRYIYYVDKNNKKRKYIIDFTYINNDNIEYIIEVKGYQQENDLYKWNATIQQGYNLDIWYLEDIKRKEQQYNITKMEVSNLIIKCIENYNDDYRKRLIQKHKQSIKSELYKQSKPKCKYCNNEFIPKKIGQKYCCDKHALLDTRPNQISINEEIICKNCGKKFIREYNTQKYCCDECFKEHRKYSRTKNNLNTKCLYCGIEFIKNSGSQKHCCKKHAALYKEQLRLKRKNK